MITKNTLSKLTLLLAVLIIAAGLAYYQLHLPGTASKAIPSQAAWDAALATLTSHILVGTIVSIRDSSVVVAVQQPNLGTTTVAVGSSTFISKNIPKSAAEMAAAFKEFQKEQAVAGGKPFTAPIASNITAVPFSALRVGDSIIITVTPSSTKDAFIAQNIEVVPSEQGGAATAAPNVPSLPALPPSPTAASTH